MARVVVDEVIERRLGDFGRPGAGPTLIVVSGIHGNEPAGVRASIRVAEALEPLGGRLRGRVVFLAGNVAALNAGQRYLERDLNRAWTDESVERVWARGDDGSPEDVEQRELLAELDPVLAEAEGPAYLLDLHTTSSEGGVFSTVSDTLPNRALALALPVPMVLGLEELVEGTLHEYLGRRGCISVAFESGQHADPSSVDRAEAAIWILLAATGLLDERDTPGLAGFRKGLARDVRSLPRAVEMRYRHGLEGEDGFRMRPGYRSFQRVQRGEALGDDRHGPIHAPESARILMPLYQVQGEDGFFIVREFRPFWLNVSYGLRRVGAHRIVHWLPGISRHPERRGALVVDRRVARWYALQVLHLLGYRRHEEHGDVLVVLRQAEVGPRTGR